MYKKANIPEEVFNRLKERQRPYQTIGGVIAEMLDTIEKVDKVQTTIPLDINKARKQ